MQEPVNIYILDYPDAMASALYGMEELFTIANRLGHNELFHVQRVNSARTNHTIQADVILIPPCMADPLPEFTHAKTLNSLKQWHQSGALLAAACAGVFWLAHAELLNGKQATTHWGLCMKLERDFPEIDKVSAREIVVDQGDIITAAGLYAFQDLCLHLIARLAGYALAKKVADFCLLDLGGRLQAYYQRFHPDFTHADSLVIKIQQFCSRHLSEGISLRQLAEQYHLSPRTLMRRFKQTTGYSPKQYTIQLRIEKARQLIELDNQSIEYIAEKLGYSDTSNFIRSFKKVAGITPAEFRARHSNRGA